MTSIAKAWRYLQHGPAHFIMYVLGRFTLVRSLVRRRTRDQFVRASRDLLVREFETSKLEPTDVEGVAKSVTKQGYCPGLRLRHEVLENIRRYSIESVCFAEGNPQFPFLVREKAHAEEKYRRKIKIGRLDHAAHECGEVQSLANDPTIIAIATRYLHCPPTFLGARIWWSFPASAHEQELMQLGQGFHYDLDGYASVAFFFYLTDVDAISGPHVVVPGSHLKKPWRAILSLHRGKPDEQIGKWYGENSHVELCGPAGSGFAEDLFCFHKGTHPERGDRLILQLRYGMRRYYGESKERDRLHPAEYGTATGA